MREVSLTKQKILIIALVVVFVLAIVMLGIMFIKKKSGTNKDNIVKNEKMVTKNGGDGQDGADSNIKNGRTENEKRDTSEIKEVITKLADGKVAGLVIKPGTNLLMFFREQKFLTVDPYTGAKSAIGSYPLIDVRKMLWNKKVDKAIVNDAGDYYIYDLINNLSNRFRNTIDTAIWNKEGDRVIYKYYNSTTKKRKIRIADIDGENSQLIVDNLPYRKVDLAVQPLTERVCYWPTPDARIKGVMFCVDLDGKNVKEYGGQFGEDYLWSPDGQKILVSFTKEEAGNQLVLGVVNKNGGENKGLAFATTVKKCVWSKDSVHVYCAMVNGAPLDVMLPNAWEEEVFNSADTFWKINTVTGKKERLVDLEKIPTVLDGADLILDPEENFLFFRARRNDSLWRIKLK